MNVSWSRLTSIELIAGDSQEDTALLRSMHAGALAYIESHSWCRDVRSSWFGCGVGGIVAVFLLDVSFDDGHDEHVWVIVGDLPSAYLVTDELSTPTDALDAYCELMEDWIAAVRVGGSLADVFPVEAAPTIEHADMLAARIEMLRSSVLPHLREGG